MVKVFLVIPKLLLILISASWISLWLLKPTELWTRKWKGAEEKATATIFGYNGLDFAVYTFPIVALAIIGFIYLELKPKEPNMRPGRSLITALSNPLIINRYLGILSAIEILASSLFIIFLIWTFYARISNDFRKMIPVKSFKLIPWQYKLFRMATRCGLLAEACLALILLPILRGMSIFRLLGIQFEASVRYHICLGTAMIFFATLHGAGTLFIWGVKHRIQDEMWKWQKTGRIYLAGEITLITGLVISITALPQIRRKWFQAFYYSHHLYIVFIVFFLFHGGDRHFYMVFPGVFLFALDKLLRIIQSRPETCILSARVFPSNAIELTLPKDPRLKYTPTSVIFLKIPSISKSQWHPFSITSSSSVDKNSISIIIKCEGQWTSSLYNQIHAEKESESDLRKCIPIATEGPYGPASLDFLRYDNLLLVAGGIGLTPFLSILQEIGSKLNNSRNKYPSRIQFIYTVKNSHEICLLEPILDQLLDVEQFHIKLKVFVTRENQPSTTLREVLKDLPDMQTTNFSTTHSSYATCGPESLTWMATIAMFSSIIFLLLLSFFNHFVVSPAKKPSQEKNSTSQMDLLLICSFFIAVVFSGLVVIIIRWKRLRKGFLSFSNEKRQPMKQSSLEVDKALDEHGIHFGRRPNFQDIFSNFTKECGGSEIGVLVCGPETMKQNLASACKLNTWKTNFCFHSLNFTL
ncbi:ferric reduction oxidase 8, mitochondrial isoform X2 [Olea europaea var. sylvestris]|uniref:ferric reduction oxidase 8, mitochondrial isoform X1 n=1 Tax=Olea europaea var. sylvestris TaxID=158386 RepID=UPI000C1D1706|nr:ferric reduction oxidase 8, mitochondrial isoform X1 [Olea europaea var. sylvestris]XP_022893017.1 ferric reduction oxidase 8, mitochondrial isoform X2 [Olea europaea var. sylvestris]